VLTIARHQVVAPGAHIWTVGIRWLPRRRATRPPSFGSGEPIVTDSELFRLVNGEPRRLIAYDTVLVVAILTAIVMFAFFVVEAIVVVVVVLALIVGRVVFRRPWTVEAVGEEKTYEWAVVGWKKSRDMIDEIAFRLENGDSLDDLSAPA
jgi:hypothetical protein